MLLEPPAPPLSPLADRPPASRPARQDGEADAITTALTAIGHAIPPYLLAPWLPVALSGLLMRAKPR